MPGTVLRLHPSDPAGGRSPYRHPSVRSPRTTLFILLAVATLLCPAAHAQFPEHLVNDDAFGEENRFDPVASPLAEGGFLLLWVDNSRGHLDIYSARFGSDLARADEPVRVNQDDDLYYLQQSPALSLPGGGVTVAVWLDGRERDGEIYAQLFSAGDGTPIGDNLDLSTDVLGLRDTPAVATQSDGRSLALWADNRSGVYRVWGQRIDADGMLLGSNFPIANENAGRTQRVPVVAALPDGGWLVAWEESVLPAGLHIRYRVLDAGGQPVGQVLSADGGSPFEQDGPALLVREEDALLAWADNREGLVDVWGLWITHDGTPTGQPQSLRATPDPARDADIRLAPGPEGSFALSWFGGVGNQQRALTRLFGSDGIAITGDLTVSEPGGQVVQRRPIPAFLPDAGGSGRWLFAWSDERTLAMQVFLQLRDLSGSVIGAPASAWSLPASASQIFGDVAFLPDGRAVSVWGDVRNGSFNIFARFLDDTGEPTGESFQVNEQPVLRRFLAVGGIQTGLPFAPRVAASGIGTFVVAWASDISGGRLALWAQLFDSEGQPIGGNFLLSRPATSPQYDARPAMGPDGRFAIAWRDDRSEENGDIFLQRFSSSGERTGDSLLVPDADARPAAQQSPAIGISPFNELVVAWIDRRSGGWDVYRQRVGMDGRRLDGRDVLVHPDDPEPLSSQLYPAVATNGDRIVVVYEDRPLTQGDIRGRLFVLETLRGDGAGSAPASPAEQVVDFAVNTSDSPDGFKHPQVSMYPDGNFVVTWWDLAEGRTRLWAQRFDSAANPVGGAYSLAADPSVGNRAYPRVSLQGDRIQYIWTDSRRGYGWDIYARRVSWQFDGDPTPVELAFARATADPQGVLLEWDIPAGAHVLGFHVWRESDDEAAGATPSPRALQVTPDILVRDVDGFRYLDVGVPAEGPVRYYLERVARDGTSEYFGPLRATPVGTPALAWRISPNPFRNRVELQPPASGPQRVAIWDVAGRRVRSLERSAGPAPLVWDGLDESGRSLPAGIYFARPETGEEALKLLLVR